MSTNSRKAFSVISFLIIYVTPMIYCLTADFFNDGAFDDPERIGAFHMFGGETQILPL